MRWPWTRAEPVREVNHTRPIPDGDTVLRPGMPHWSDLLGPAVPTASLFVEATQPLPLTSPLMTAGARWRTRRSQR